MESKLKTDEINSLQLETSGHSTIIIRSNDENTVPTVDYKNSVRKRRYTWFEWIQLIATICIPVIIAVYTIVENSSSTSIADKNRRKDLEIANISRASEFEIAQANRLSEMIIAERSREKDRELALDQQRQNILVEYHNFLAKLILDNGIALSKSPTAKIIARSMTITAISQLDAARKSILLRSLAEMRLINLERKSTPDGTSILELRRVDLSDTTFSLYRYSINEHPDFTYNYWNYLWLPGTILTNASFRYVFMDCVTFSECQMDSVDMSFAMIRSSTCFDAAPDTPTDFSSTSLVNASLYKATFRKADFSKAYFKLTNMRHFICRDCTFSSAVFIQVDLSFSEFIVATLKQQTATFFSAQLRQVVAHSATFRSVNFANSTWSNVQASEIYMENCTFSNVTMKNCSFAKSKIRESSFRYASLYDIDISDGVLYNVSFINSDMRNASLSYITCDYCNFINVQLQGAVFKNASFRYSNFLNSHIDASQLQEVIDLTGTTLPNGIVVP